MGYYITRLTGRQSTAHTRLRPCLSGQGRRIIYWQQHEEFADFTVAPSSLFACSSLRYIVQNDLSELLVGLLGNLTSQVRTGDPPPG